VLTGPIEESASLLTRQFAERWQAVRRSTELRVAEIKNSGRIDDARKRFRKRHKDHTPQALDNIDRALSRVTRDNPDLRFSYYDYYSDHKLTDELENARRAGDTSYGDTNLNPRVLNLNSDFPTSDPLDLLGETLIHEYVHTSQGGGKFATDMWNDEAKAYAVEYFFADRSHDNERAAQALRRGTDYNTRIFNACLRILEALYKVIESGVTQMEAATGKLLSAEDARRLSVEFISKNGSFSPDLQKFVNSL
jgi:hypothetical protein